MLFELMYSFQKLFKTDLKNFKTCVIVGINAKNNGWDKVSAGS